MHVQAQDLGCNSQNRDPFLSDDLSAPTNAQPDELGQSITFPALAMPNPRVTGFEPCAMTVETLIKPSTGSPTITLCVLFP
jgi:hypothetical protein